MRSVGSEYQAVIERALSPKYKILEEAGRGGMAVVYKVLHVPGNKIMALKVLLPYASQNRSLVRTFRREGNISFNLDHKGIVRVYDTGRMGGVDYLAMEFIEGTTLTDLLQEKKKLPYLDVIKIGHQVAKTLAYAHNQNVVHRDIKPSNIMIPDNLNRNILITDFGIATRLDASEQLTVDRQGFGTSDFMSPEQARGDPDERITQSTDIWSLGVVLYEALTGMLPFTGQSYLETLENVKKRNPRPIRLLESSTPPYLERLILSCLHKDSKKRISAHALAASLIAGGGVKRGVWQTSGISDELILSLARILSSVAIVVFFGLVLAMLSTFEGMNLVLKAVFDGFSLGLPGVLLSTSIIILFVLAAYFFSSAIFQKKPH